MSDTFKLALQLTMIDMLSGVAERAKKHILNLGDAGKEVKRDFDLMTHHITRGLQGVAAAHYGFKQMQKGIAPAADLQESMIDVRMSLMRSGKDAGKLNDELEQVRKTAIAVSKIAPFSAMDVTGIQNEFLKAGLEFDSVVGKSGAAAAATMLATITKDAPDTIARAMVTIGAPFNIEGKGYAELADQLQRHGMNSVAKVPDLMEGMKYVSGTASHMKIPWKDTLTSLAVIGEQGMIGTMGGTALNDFLTRLTGTSRITRRVLQSVNAELKHQGRDPLEFWDKKGKLKSMPTIITNLRQAMTGFNDHQKMFILDKVFEVQGARAALALMKEGLGSWEATVKKNEEAASLQEKMNERLKGFNANVKALGGTTKTTLATMFDPMLGPLTLATQKTNDLVDATGRFAAEHPAMTTTGNALLTGAVATAGAYALWNLAKGGLAGSRVLKGLGGVSGIVKGMAGTGIGIAEGKAVQAATGVQPVFVTNWPAGGLSPEPVVVPTGVPMAAKALPYAALAGGAVLTAAAASIPASMYLSGKSRENGWGTESIFHNDRRYEVMGIGRQPVKNDITVDISFDDLGRALIKTRDMNTTTRINSMKRGDFFGALMTTEGTQ